MLDNERTRWINATLFFAIGWQVTLMVVSPSTVDVPFERFKMSDFPFILRKLLTIAYYLVVFAPVVMAHNLWDCPGTAFRTTPQTPQSAISEGRPSNPERWDLFGLMITMFYVWIFAIFNYLRDYNCAVYFNPYYDILNPDEHSIYNIGLRLSKLYCSHCNTGSQWIMRAVLGFSVCKSHYRLKS